MPFTFNALIDICTSVLFPRVKGKVFILFPNGPKRAVKACNVSYRVRLPLQSHLKSFNKSL